MQEKEKAVITTAKEEQRKGRLNSAEIQQNPAKSWESRLSVGQINKLIDATVCRAAEEAGGQLPVDALNISVRRYVLEVERVTQCPRDYVVGAVFTVAGAAVGKSAEVVFGSYRNFPCLWSVLVGDPSAGKTPALREVIKPLRRKNADTYAEYQSKCNSMEAGDKPPKWDGQILIANSTPESRNEALSRIKRGIIYSSDEVGAMCKDFGRYNSGGEVDEMNSIWVSEDYTVNRATKDPLLISQPFMAVLGGTQRASLRKTFLKEDLIECGFSCRFLFFVPAELPSRKLVEATVPDELRRQWAGLVGRLWNMPYREIHLSEEAKPLFKAFFDKVQADMREEPDARVQQYMGKLNYQLLRWALILHLLNEDPSDEVSAEEMEYSVRCMAYFLRTWRELIGETGEAVKAMGNEELIACFCSRFAVKNQSETAKLIGKSQQAVSKAVKKYSSKYPIR